MAQLAARGSHNPKVASSILAGSTAFCCLFMFFDKKHKKRSYTSLFFCTPAVFFFKRVCTKQGGQKKLHVRESNPGRLRDRQKCYQLHQHGQASNEDRTRDLTLTKRVLCQLSYRGDTAAFFAHRHAPSRSELTTTGTTAGTRMFLTDTAGGSSAVEQRTVKRLHAAILWSGVQISLPGFFASLPVFNQFLRNGQHNRAQVSHQSPPELRWQSEWLLTTRSSVRSRVEAHFLFCSKQTGPVPGQK